MKTFKCCYETEDGRVVDKNAYIKIEAESHEQAALIYQQEYPSLNPRIMVLKGLTTPLYFDNITLDKKQKEEEKRVYDARINSLRELAAAVENTDGNLADLSYENLAALIENMRDFRDARDGLSAEECVLRERLYMKASFDSDLQTLLQTDLLRDVKSSCEDLLAVLAAHTKSSKGSNKSALLGAAAGLAAPPDPKSPRIP